MKQKRLYYFFHKETKVSDRNIETVVNKATELLSQEPDLRKIQIYTSSEDTEEDEPMITLPVKDAPGKPYLTADWLKCYNLGCSFLRLQNGNEVFCEKGNNPNHPVEIITTPTQCPVKFPDEKSYHKRSTKEN